MRLCAVSLAAAFLLPTNASAQSPAADIKYDSTLPLVLTSPPAPAELAQARTGTNGVPLPPQDRAATQAWQISLGGGALVAPEYPGADSYKASPVPAIDITYRNTIFLNSRNGLGAYAINNDRYTLGGSLFFRGGRDEDDSDRLRGMGDIDAAAQGRIFGRVAFGPVDLGATLTKDFGGSDGFTADVTLSSNFKIGERIRLTPGGFVSYGDDDFMETWFGVSGDQSSRSGLARYDAGGSIKSVGAFLRGSYQLTDNWSLASSIRLEYLTGDAADSPIVEQRVQPSFALTVNYRF
jgi:outer membrane protein